MWRTLLLDGRRAYGGVPRVLQRSGRARSTRLKGATMQPCKIGWCVSFAVPESEYCAVHKGTPQFTPTSVEVKAGLWTFEYESESCDVCFGESEHECSCG